MVLFFISLVLTALSAFFITSVIERKEFIRAFIYFFAIMFAEVVLVFEILSLFSAISAAGVLVLNILSATGSGVMWFKCGKPFLKLSPKPFFIRLVRTLKHDKYLLVLGIAFLFMCGTALFLISFMPVTSADAATYHVVRSLFWIGNRNLNHFDITEVRMLTMPINSEILYAWILMLTKKQLWFGIFPFIGLWMGLISLYGIMSYIKIPERKKLWVLLIVSSFPSIIVQISGTETDIIVGGLVLSSMYLYWNALKTSSGTPLVLSSICYALAIGTKTPAIILIPAVGLWMAGISYPYYKKEFYKPLLKFIGCSFISFMLFASYNYILNLINFGNLAGPAPFLLVHENIYGVRGMIANFVKHLFLFFDFTGFTWSYFVGKHLIAAKTLILSTLGLGQIPDGLHSRGSDFVNNTLLEPCIGLGILGFLAYLPCWVKSLIVPVYSHKKREIIIFTFGLLLLTALLLMSYEIMFMSYNIRFLTCFCFIAAPVLVYSYPRKNLILKCIITFFALYSLIFVSTNLWARPAAKIFSYFRSGKTISEIREIAKCSKYYKKLPKNPKIKDACKMESTIRNFDKRNKILYFSSNSEQILLTKMLMLEGYHIDFGRIENIQNIDLSQYNMIIVLENKQCGTNIIHTNMAHFYPAKGAECIYTNSANQVYNPNKDKAPYISNCQLSSQFFTLNGFKLYSTLKTTLRQNRDSITIEYKFYENVNKRIF